jgi:hypothetical protein
LLGAPVTSGMFGHVEMNNPSSVVRQEDEHMKKLEGNGRHNKEVERDDF